MHQIAEEANDIHVRSLNVVSAKDGAVKIYLCCLFMARRHFILFKLKDIETFSVIWVFIKTPMLESNVSTVTDLRKTST